MQDFERDPENTCLQLGVLFGWDGQLAQRTTGRLLILRLQVPPSLENLPCQPVVTEDEVVEGRFPSNSEF